ncbi:MAG TPA: ferritin-like domain-containing protein [Bdellovibrionales bacterium]|nr:ferritin-like domain-containing protein [Bdellovibrionales bacterium]
MNNGPGKHIEVKNLLSTELMLDDRRLESVLRSAFGASDIVAPSAPLWNASFFGLDRTRLFKFLKTEIQDKIVAACSRNLLTEAYAIEKIGMGFTAKMSLLSETLEERMLYSAFAYDEASHFHKISQFLEEPPTGLEKNPFLAMLAHLIENEERPVLVLIIQVMLEGWGLHHYRQMVEACAFEPFTRVMKDILRDEARHHGSGLAITSRDRLTEAQKARAADIMSVLFQMVQAGPQSVVQEVDKACGGLSRNLKTQLFEDLQAEAHARTRLDLLSNLIPPGSSYLHETLDQRGVLRPLTPTECATL